jgi:pimeloyl-ACP methyl ester carboxylesterase
METQTHTLETPDVDLVYDVRGPSPTAGGRPPLLMAGHPMDARGFDTLASYFSDRTVVTYDPRGIGRSIRKDGRDDRTPELHTADLHALITALGIGPVDVFGSSGGAVNALALVAEHPEDVGTLVAHEPPLLTLLPDADHALAADRDVQAAYHHKGFGTGTASSP